MGIRRDAIDRGAAGLAARMLRDQPPPPPRWEREAPAVNNANQPSYYGPGTTPVVSTAPKYGVRGDPSQTWTMQIVPCTHVATYGLGARRIPKSARVGSDKVAIYRQGDGAWTFRRPRRRRRTGFTRAPSIIVHDTRPVVLRHLEPRDIICESHAQAEAECARVGKQIAR